MMNLMTRALALVCLGLCVGTASAQTAAGTSTTTCSQNGTVLTCTTSTTVTLPSGVNLTPASGVTQFGLTGSASGPSCTGVTANPSSVAAGGLTAVALVTSCPSGNYTYTWASPVSSSTSTASIIPNLSAGTPSATYSVTVCFAANANACNTYSTTVTLIAATPTLSGCVVTPSTTTVNQGTTPILSATCSAGTGSGSGVSYAWKKNGSSIAGATLPTYQLTVTDTASAGTATYSVDISNNAPSTAQASAIVTVQSVVLGGTDYCPNTPVRTTINAGSSVTGLVSSDYVGSFSAGDNFVIQLDVAGSDTTLGRQLAYLNFSDAGSNRGGRYVTISQNKCDYTSSAQWVTSNFLGQTTPQNAASKTVGLNDANSSAPVKLTTGRWFINVQNVVGYCPSNYSCNIVLNWSNN